MRALVAYAAGERGQRREGVVRDQRCRSALSQGVLDERHAAGDCDEEVVAFDAPRVGLEAAYLGRPGGGLEPAGRELA